MEMFVIFLFILIVILTVANFIKTDRLINEIRDLKKSLADTYSVNQEEKVQATPPPLPQINPVSDNPINFECPAASEYSLPSDSTDDAIFPVEEDFPQSPQTNSKSEPPAFNINHSDNINHSEEIPAENKNRNHSFNFENFIGGNLLSKIGILALVAGIGFFVKYAIDNDWINEVGRTVLGLLTGLGIWAIAFKLRNSYRSFSSVLAGGGFAICFVTIALAHQFYNLIPWSMAFGSFTILSIAMIFLSLRYDRRELALIAILGGFVSPCLIINSGDNLIFLFSYIALLAIAVFIISMQRHWWELSLFGIILTWIIVAVSITPQEIAATRPLIYIGFTTLFFTLFSFPIAIEMENEKGNRIIYPFLIILTLLNPLAYLYLSIRAVDGLAPFNLFKGFFPLYVSSVNLLILVYLNRKGIKTILSSISLWITVVFAAIFIPVQFSRLSIWALGFSIYALILCVAFIKTGKKFIIFTSFFITLATIGVLLETIFKNYGYPSDTTLFCMGVCYLGVSILIDRKWRIIQNVSNLLCHNFYGITLYMGCLFIFFASSGFAHKTFIDVNTASSVAFLVGMIEILAVSIFGRISRYTSGFLPLAGVLLFITDSLLCYPDSTAEITLHWISALTFASSLYIFTKRIAERSGKTNKKPTYIYYSLIASVFIITCVFSFLENCGLSRFYSAGLSISLILSGTLLMLAGMYYRLLSLRVEALIFFSILVIKLVTYDIWRLPVVGRIIVFILLGAVLLCISFLYQKLKDKLFTNPIDKHPH